MPRKQPKRRAPGAGRPATGRTRRTITFSLAEPTIERIEDRAREMGANRSAALEAMLSPAQPE